VTVVPLTFLDPLLQRGELLGCHRALFEKREGELRSSSATDWFNSYSYSGGPGSFQSPAPATSRCRKIPAIAFVTLISNPD
jgi:hypothetical protein